MTMLPDFITRNGAASKASPEQSWQLGPVKPLASSRPIFRRLFRRKAPTLFHRCLAVHIHFAEPHGGLS